jgi:hypothetical protein
MTFCHLIQKNKYQHSYLLMENPSFEGTYKKYKYLKIELLTQKCHKYQNQMGQTDMFQAPQMEEQLTEITSRMD